MRESSHGAERQAGRGAGESALEIDRRKIRDRIAELREQLEAIQKEQSNRRAHRREARTVALVGYTNAGKSSWMRALTGSSVLVADKLFATLDTTVRALHPEVKPRVLVSDTVGFIKKLPHDLVASFRSTLDEALEATLLLHLVDGSDPTWRSELQVTRDVLAEIGADRVDTTLVFNKADQIDEAEQKLLRREFPGSLVVSSRNPDDVARLRQYIIDFFDQRMVDAEILVPYSQQKLVSELHEQAHVIKEDYREDGVLVQFRAEPATAEKLKSKLV
ncbi:MAG: GTPase HflX [Polyangiaceae bacterium]